MSTKLVAMATENEPLINRAFAAYARECARRGVLPHTPANTSSLIEHDGKRYVVLHNVNGVLAVYRVRNDGILKGLRRWPKEIEDR